MSRLLSFSESQVDVARFEKLASDPVNGLFDGAKIHVLPCEVDLFSLDDAKQGLSPCFIGMSFPDYLAWKQNRSCRFKIAKTTKFEFVGFTNSDPYCVWHDSFGCSLYSVATFRCKHRGKTCLFQVPISFVRIDEQDLARQNKERMANMDSEKLFRENIALKKSLGKNNGTMAQLSARVKALDKLIASYKEEVVFLRSELNKEREAACRYQRLFGETLGKYDRLVARVGDRFVPCGAIGRPYKGFGMFRERLD